MTITLHLWMLPVAFILGTWIWAGSQRGNHMDRLGHYLVASFLSALILAFCLAFWLGCKY